MTRDAETANKFTGTYTVEAGDDTEADTVLSVASYNSGTLLRQFDEGARSSTYFGVKQ